jgi:hypothetical protein
LGVFASPDFAEVIPLEGKGQFRKMLSGVASQWYGEIEAESNLPTAVVGELVELLVGFGTSFAQQNFEVFQSGRVDGTKAEGAENIRCRFDEPLSGQHQIG